MCCCRIFGFELIVAYPTEGGAMWPLLIMLPSVTGWDLLGQPVDVSLKQDCTHTVNATAKVLPSLQTATLWEKTNQCLSTGLPKWGPRAILKVKSNQGVPFVAIPLPRGTLVSLQPWPTVGTYLEHFRCLEEGLTPSHISLFPGPASAPGLP